MKRSDWSRSASYGIVWGVAVAAMESFELPLGNLTAHELLIFLTNLLPHQCTAGVVLAVVAISSAGRPWDWALTAWVLVVFPLMTIAFNQLLSFTLALQPLWATNPGSSYLHTYWMSLFYGGLFVVAYRLSVRSERIRGQLAQTEIARQQAQSLVTSTNFEALKGHVDPAFLLRIMEAVQLRYSRDAKDADRLLERLVGFLRAAMPGIRSGASTLAVELELAMQYNHVLRELDGDAARLNVQAEGEVPDIPFPSLLMLPVLDEVCACADGAAIDVRVRQGRGSCAVTFHAAGSRGAAGISADLLYRLQVGLRVLFGSDWSLEFPSPPNQTVLELTLPANRGVLHSSTAMTEVSYG